MTSPSKRLGHTNFLEINDCIGPVQQRIECCKDRTSSGASIRRSSSLQFPPRQSTEQKLQQKTKQNAHFNFIHSAICTLKSSSASIYASTLSVAGLLNGVGLDGFHPRRSTSRSSTEAVNLYMMMMTYRCCCGILRLRVASMLIGLFICISSTLMLGSLLIHYPISPTALFTIWQYQIIKRPAILICILSILAGLLFLLALATDIHFLILPFLLSCILNMMGSLAFGLVLLMNPLSAYLPFIRNFGTFAKLIPASIALGTSALIMLNLWFLVLAAFTYVLIRDKQSLFIEYFNNDYMDEENGTAKLVIHRSSSAPINRMNSAEI